MGGAASAARGGPRGKRRGDFDAVDDGGGGGDVDGNALAELGDFVIEYVDEGDARLEGLVIVDDDDAPEDGSGSPVAAADARGRGGERDMDDGAAATPPRGGMSRSVVAASTPGRTIAAGLSTAAERPVTAPRSPYISSGVGEAASPAVPPATPSVDGGRSWRFDREDGSRHGRGAERSSGAPTAHTPTTREGGGSERGSVRSDDQWTADGGGGGSRPAHSRGPEMESDRDESANAPQQHVETAEEKEARLFLELVHERERKRAKAARSLLREVKGDAVEASAYDDDDDYGARDVEHLHLDGSGSDSDDSMVGRWKQDNARGECHVCPCECEGGLLWDAALRSSRRLTLCVPRWIAAGSPNGAGDASVEQKPLSVEDLVQLRLVRRREKDRSLRRLQQERRLKRDKVARGLGFGAALDHAGGASAGDGGGGDDGEDLEELDVSKPVVPPIASPADGAASRAGMGKAARGSVGSTGSGGGTSVASGRSRRRGGGAGTGGSDGGGGTSRSTASTGRRARGQDADHRDGDDPVLHETADVSYAPPTSEALGMPAGYSRVFCYHDAPYWILHSTKSFQERHGALRTVCATATLTASSHWSLMPLSMPCCAVLCCAVLCCAVLCCAVLCCAVLCCAVLCCAVLCCAVLCCVDRACGAREQGAVRREPHPRHGGSVDRLLPHNAVLPHSQAQRSALSLPPRLRYYVTTAVVASDSITLMPVRTMRHADAMRGAVHRS
jgi:hypothetical protein